MAYRQLPCWELLENCLFDSRDTQTPPPPSPHNPRKKIFLITHIELETVIVITDIQKMVWKVQETKKQKKIPTFSNLELVQSQPIRLKNPLCNPRPNCFSTIHCYGQEFGGAFLVVVGGGGGCCFQKRISKWKTRIQRLFVPLTAFLYSNFCLMSRDLLFCNPPDRSLARNKYLGNPQLFWLPFR